MIFCPGFDIIDLSCFSIISLRKRGLSVLSSFYVYACVSLCLDFSILMVPWVGLCSVTVEIPVYTLSCVFLFIYIIQIRKVAKIRNQNNQVPHLTQDSHMEK